MLRPENKQGYMQCRHLSQGKNHIAQRLMNKFLFLFKSIEGLGIPTKNNTNIIDIANEIIHKKKANDGKITEFLIKIKISGKERDLLEKSTCGQANNSAWKELRRMTEVTFEDIINLFRYL